MKRLKVVQIGAAHAHADGAIQTMRELDQYYEILGVCEWDEAVINVKKQSPAYKGIKWLTKEELWQIEDLDAVVIETDELVLTKEALEAAKKKVHIYMDKPGGENHREYKELIETARKHQLVFQTGYMYRYNPAIKDMLHKVRSGELGEIISVEAQMSVRSDEEERQNLSRYQGGMMFFLGCHLVDIIYAVLGEPQEIIPYHSATGMGGIDALDYGFAVFKYPNGVSFVKTNATELNGFIRRQIVVTGTKGSLEIKPVEYYNEKGLCTQTKLTLLDQNGCDPRKWWEGGECREYVVGARYREMFLQFARAVNGEADPETRYDYDYELKLHELIMRACNIRI